MVQKLVPLCSRQYERQFNTVRIPGKETGRDVECIGLISWLLFLDRLLHYTDSHHIAVYHRGRWYKIFMFYKNSLLEPCELQLYVSHVI